MDDLMIDSHPVHMSIFYAVVEQHGGDTTASRLTAQEEASLFGLKISDAWKVFIDKFGLSSEPMTLQAEFDDLLIPMFESSGSSPMPGLIPLVRQLQQHVPLALASSASRRKIDVVLAQLGLTDDFKAIVSGEDEIERGKPHPDIFLMAARKLQLPPSACAVFEDARNGIEAAKAAGTFAVGVHNQFSKRRLGVEQDLSRADLEVNGLDELTFERGPSTEQRPPTSLDL